MTENEKVYSKEFDDFYQAIRFELELLEGDFFKLEKEYFAITPVYDKIFNRLDRLQKASEENQASLIGYRIKNLRRQLKHFHKNSGYNLDAFSEIFKQLHTLKSKLPDEVFSEPALQVIKEKVKLEASKWISGGLPRKSPLHKHLALQNDGTCFLVPFRRKLWEKSVESAGRVRIQIKSAEGDKVFSFRALPGNVQSQTRFKQAILLESEKGVKFGILADKIEGVMIFSEKFLKKKTDYFPVGNGNFTPCLNLHGKRYFLRNDYEKHDDLAGWQVQK